MHNHTDMPTAVTAAPRDIFNRAWEAYQNRDWETLLTLYADTAELILPGTAPIKGREQIVRTWQQLSEGFPDDGGTYSCVISSNNVAGGEKVYHGTNTGPLPVPGTDTTLPATGKRISLAEADFITVNDGRIHKHICYYDRLGYAAQLGIMSAE
jgi:ketosteroid isomerase-like protein